MSMISFADVVHQSVTFSKNDPAEALVLQLIDTHWVQRLRDISQTANTRLVFMFSEHSRFGHSVGVAYLACELMKKLKRSNPDQVLRYERAVAAAAILHDVGHIAPGSHTAYKTWYPDGDDIHEEISAKILSEDQEIVAVLRTAGGDELLTLVRRILDEDEALPAWTWQLLSGGGWNVDRGNWCMVDSILAGVRYGEYNIPALIDSMVITDSGSLALRENRLDAMMHFAVSRHAMYRQIYQHRVILAADMLNRALVMRLRDLSSDTYFADDTMRRVLASTSPRSLDLDDIDAMREPWWRYHCSRWQNAADETLAGLARRIIDRRLFKTVRVTDDEAMVFQKASQFLISQGKDPKYFLHRISTSDVHSGDSRQAMPVIYDNQKILSLYDSEPLFKTLVESDASRKRWLVMPSEVLKHL